MTTTPKRLFFKFTEPLRPDQDEPEDELTEEERRKLLEHVDADDEAMT